MVLEMAIPEGEHGATSRHRFFLHHQKPSAAAKPIAGGAGNEQKQILLGFPLVVPLQGKTAPAHSAARGSGALGFFLELRTPQGQRSKRAPSVPHHSVCRVSPR